MYDPESHWNLCAFPICSSHIFQALQKFDAIIIFYPCFKKQIYRKYINLQAYIYLQAAAYNIMTATPSVLNLI